MPGRRGCRPLHTEVRNLKGIDAQMKYLGLVFIFLFVFTLAVLYVIIGEGDFINIIDISDNSSEIYIDNSDIVDVFSSLSVLQPETSKNLQTLIESSEFIVSVYDIETKEILHKELDDYLCGVVFAEMPSSFEIEALKAQAVAARSYCVYKMLYFNEREREFHHGADVCTDSAHCKAYISYDKACGKWGEEYILPLWEKVKNAVTDTSGEIIVYDSEPAIAVFHAMSNRTTESAENIWGGNVPYLVSVPTSESEAPEAIKNFSTASAYSPQEFKSRLISNGFRGDFNEKPELWIGDITYNSSGRVDNIKICGKAISGKRLREIFLLRATDFYLEYKKIDDRFVFDVKGYGHGVGMSQYGANLMAREGKSYDDILMWYYTGVEIINMYENPKN